jgi:hypothetical protein
MNGERPPKEPLDQAPPMITAPGVGLEQTVDLQTQGMLEALAYFVRGYVVLGPEELTAIALWVAHSHAFDAADASPYLSITSPEKESGKTRLLEVLELIVARPWFTGRVTAAVLSRKIDAETPTLLLDESDAAFNGEKEYAETLRGILNTGYRRGGKSSLCIGQGAGITYTDLSTFSAKAIAGIGDLPDTVASRSIAIRLKRRAPGEQIQRFIRREAVGAGENLYEWVRSWAEMNVDHLAVARPKLLDDLSDRAADVWEPLFAIADMAGEEWATKARAAALKLSGDREDVTTIRVQLLGDCQRILNGYDRLPTKELIAALVEDEEAPWGGWHKGSPISPRALAGLLEPFGIRSRSIRLESGDTPKGYVRESFEDAFKRYLSPHPPDLSATPPQPASEAGSEAFSTRHTPPLVADTKSDSNPHEQSVVADVADRNGVQGLQAADALLSDTSEADFWAERIESHESGERAADS